jgi:hypothetical protein
MTPASFLSHPNSKDCNSHFEKKNRRQARLDLAYAQRIVFTVDGQPLKKVPLFKHLGRMVSEINSDYPTLYRNLRRAKQKWALLSRVVTKDAVLPWAAAIFYKVIVQTVLLYSCECWTITPTMLKILRGFHHRVIRRITGKVARLEQGVWIYPPIREALAESNMEPIEVYIQRRQARMVQALALRPMIPLITGRETSQCLRWWEQATVVDEPPAADAGAVDGEDSVASP